MSTYLTLRNCDSVVYYPDNNGYRFTVMLNQPLELNEHWEVGLCEITILHKSKTSPKHDNGNYEIYIYSNLGGTMYVGENQQQLLRRILAKSKDQGAIHRVFNSPFYVPVLVRECREISIWLKLEDGSFPSHLRDTSTSITLELKKQPFI
jgi:hypothetical protein